VGELPLTRPDDGTPEGVADQHDDEPVLPASSTDEQDVGWGDDAAARGREFYEAERPPHHE
jgi:hypothetical protein